MFVLTSEYKGNATVIAASATRASLESVARAEMAVMLTLQKEMFVDSDFFEDEEDEYWFLTYRAQMHDQVQMIIAPLAVV